MTTRKSIPLLPKDFWEFLRDAYFRQPLGAPVAVHFIIPRNREQTVTFNPVSLKEMWE